MEKKTSILIQNLSVSYGNTQAVDGISLAIYEGECFGLLSPNDDTFLSRRIEASRQWHDYR
jgi:ABC-type uncharacterized transport system ATPase subunit